jgi:enoyl-CoA hydratase/carnithine racemase
VTGLQLPFDFRFAWEGAKITLPFVRRGISPEGSHSFLARCLLPNSLTVIATSAYLLPRLIGLSRASSLILSGATVNPTSPLVSSLYHQILPTREEVYPAGKAFADELAANTSQTAIAYAKALLRHPGESMEENHLRDSWVFSALLGEEDANEGATSFRERRVKGSEI